MKIMDLAKSTAFALVLVSLVIVSGGQISFSQGNDFEGGPPCGPEGHGGPPSEAMHRKMKQELARELDLTPDQQARIDALQKAFHESHKAEFESKKAQFDALRQLEESGASQSEIQAKRQALKPDFSAMRADREKLDGQIKALLTPQQAQKFEAMIARKKAQFEQGRPPRP